MIEITKKAKGHLHVVCSSEFEHLDRIVDEAESFVSSIIKDDDFTYKIVLLLSEAVTNAIEHGNAYDAAKKVVVDLKIDSKQAQITVEDEGKGFERSNVQDPTDKENLLMDGGRGIFFIEQMADDVSFELNGRRVNIFFKRE